MPLSIVAKFWLSSPNLKIGIILVMTNEKTLAKIEPDYHCNARTKGRTAYCSNRAGFGTDHPGEGRCKLHGGSSLSGVNHGMYKHGRRSGALPRRLLADFQQAAVDPELMSLRGDIALIDARITDLLKRVDSGEAGSLWRQAKTAMSNFRKAQNSKTMEAETKRQIMAESLSSLEQLITKGVGDYRAWDELGKSMNDRRRMIDSEHKRAVAMGQMMTADAVITLIDSIQSIIKETVSDPDLRIKVASKIMGLIDKDADYEGGDVVEGEFRESD